MSVDDDEAVLTQAGEWLLELQSPNISVERIVLWQQWLARSERHARAFDELHRTWRFSDRLLESDRAALPWPTAAELGAPDAPRHRTHWRRLALSAAAALAAIAIGLGLLLYPASDSQQIATTTGEHRELTLPDGSHISIGADSQLLVTYRTKRRSIELTRGEAYFEVAKDAARPFSVRAGTMSVTALGTAFNVRLNGDRVVVGVAEGTVRVAPEPTTLLARIGIDGDIDPARATRLEMGHRLVAEPQTSSLAKIDPIAPPSVAGWRRGRLEYVGDPLAVVVADLNRYSTQPIVIDDPAIGTLRVTASVSETNIMGWLRTLPSSFPLELVAHDDGAVALRKRR
ncbi:FecR family protein [Steroidobacter sp.]|uniref:FecR family protein n=1 Tax=Steroidobacter sp. TaxID=1978227 RepID=UPI001A4623FE|nr:FecR domain-containing protein [Steroidobacter sp.]MBL8271406.1 FecR domain-containing protein [Steroidobacter sp.]